MEKKYAVYPHLQGELWYEIVEIDPPFSTNIVLFKGSEEACKDFAFLMNRAHKHRLLYEKAGLTEDAPAEVLHDKLLDMGIKNG